MISGKEERPDLNFSRGTRDDLLTSKIEMGGNTCQAPGAN